MTKNGEDCLMIAIRKGFKDMVHLLLKVKNIPITERHITLASRKNFLRLTQLMKTFMRRRSTMNNREKKTVMNNQRAMDNLNKEYRPLIYNSRFLMHKPMYFASLLNRNRNVISGTFFK
eukprot:UN27537